jgi:hypothetical protein
MRAGVKDTSLRQRFEFGTQMRQRIRLGYGLKGPRVERSRWRDLLPPLQGGKKVIVPFGSRPHKDDGKQHGRVGRGTRPTLGYGSVRSQPQRGCGPFDPDHRARPGIPWRHGHNRVAVVSASMGVPRVVLVPRITVAGLRASTPLALETGCLLPQLPDVVCFERAHDARTPWVASNLNLQT